MSNEHDNKKLGSETSKDLKAINTSLDRINKNLYYLNRALTDLVGTVAKGVAEISNLNKDDFVLTDGSDPEDVNQRIHLLEA